MSFRNVVGGVLTNIGGSWFPLPMRIIDIFRWGYRDMALYRLDCYGSPSREIRARLVAGSIDGTPIFSASSFSGFTLAVGQRLNFLAEYQCGTLVMAIVGSFVAPTLIRMVIT